MECPETCGLWSTHPGQERYTILKLTLRQMVNCSTQSLDTLCGQLEVVVCFSAVPTPFNPSRGMKVTFSQHFLCSAVMK